LRGGELVVRHQVRDRDEQWVVRARTATGDAAGEAGRVRNAVEHGLSVCARVAVSVDGDEPQAITSTADVIRWCAAFDPETTRHTRLPWWRRPLGGSTVEPVTELTRGSRWAVAAAAAAPLVMLLGPLGYGPGEMAAVLLAIAGAAAVSVYAAARFKLLRQLAGLVAGVGVGAVLIDVSAITSAVASLRFLMPQLLVALVVMQGFECVDRRSARVSLACSGLITAYAAGIRVDGELGAWLLIACLVIAAASQTVSRVDRRVPTPVMQTSERGRLRPVAVRGTGVGVAAAAVLALLAVVPVPRGPAQLTLPSWLQERRPTASSGALADTRGVPLLGGANTGGGTRSGNTPGSTGGSGGYPGFSPTMDTSLRGPLGDEVVLRVRAPYPDFWRGQTFTRFDGRTWFVDDRLGKRTDGPEHLIKAADGDIRTDEPGEFIQSFYAEVDLPNIVFAANQPDRVLLDAPLWQRPDGALRADVVLPKGSAYTVVSQRSGVTASRLRDQGKFETNAPPMYTNVPNSTSERTRDLARQLAVGSASHYDTILAIQGWLGSHVTYNLDAPVPPAGADAVDDFLFESQQGFCEQIASATAVMLRSLGVPARIATGYVPSERDEVAGVWISRASDAHAWVEVHFPSYGWVAFDPTASVPLSGEAKHTTIGGDLVKALVGGITAHLPEIVIVGLGVVVALTVVRTTRAWWRRRRRGRWGVLQDRFVAAAVKRGAPPTAPNAVLADVFDLREAADLADVFDASIFASSWADDNERYTNTARTLRQLERSTSS
jgi:transglutaminase-like putative cysteine protease